MANNKLTGRARSVPAGIAIGVTSGLLITVLTVAIAAHLVSIQFIDQENIGYCALAALLLGSMADAAIAAKLIKHRILLVSIASGVSYILVLLSVTALFFKGQYHGVGVTVVTVMIGSIAASLLSSREYTKKNRHKPKKVRR